MRWRGAGRCGRGAAPEVADPLAILRASLPEGAVAAGGPIGTLQVPLMAGEDATLTRARDRRRADFIAGRTAARQALAALGLPASALPRDPRGPALWPAGVTGSISHGAGWALAAVTRRDGFAGLGIDIEAAGAFVPLEDIATAQERDALGQRDPVILFSAKEAAYKAQFALTGHVLGFHDLQLVLTDHGFTARLLHDAPPLAAGAVICGRWSAAGGIVVTTAAIPA